MEGCADLPNATQTRNTDEVLFTTLLEVVTKIVTSGYFEVCHKKYIHHNNLMHSADYDSQTLQLSLSKTAPWPSRHSLLAYSANLYYIKCTLPADCCGDVSSTGRQWVKC